MPPVSRFHRGKVRAIYLILLGLFLSAGAILGQPGPQNPGNVQPVSAAPVSATPPTRATTPSQPPATPPPGTPPLAATKVVYLSFDDGPHPLWTPKILALLTQHSAKATFFQVGREVKASPAVAASVLSNGHAVGNHTGHHLNLLHRTRAEIDLELRSGVPAARCFRPPFGAGAKRPEVKAAAAALNQRIILWTVDPRDWAKPGAAAISARVLAAVHPGSVVLLHDGGGDRSQTVAATAVILRRLSSQGYQFRVIPGC